MAPTIHILQILSCQPTLSRRQQLYVSLLAASGQIDDLFDHHHQRLISRDKNVRKKVAVSSEVKNVINLDDYVCDSKDEDEVFCKLSASLCNLTVKALESLMKSIEEAKAQKAISSGDCCAASLIPYLFSLTSHLLLTRVSPPSTLAEKARDSSFPISISSILTCASSPAASLAHQATEFFTQEFLHLLDVSMGGGSTSDEYSLEIDQVCDNAPLVWVTSILAALTLPASQSSSSSIFNGSIAKVVEMLKMFIVQSLKPIPKEENQQDSPELMATPYSHIEMDDGTSSASSRKLELVELFSAVSLCAVKTLKLIFRSNLTASMLLSCSCDIVPFKKCTGDDTLLINDSLNPTCSDLIVSCTQYSRSGNNDRDGNDDFEVTSKQLSPPSSHWGPLFFSRVIVEQKVIEIQQHLQKFIDNSKDEIVQTYNAKNYEGRQEEDDDATQDSTRPSGRPSFRNHSELPAVAKDNGLIFGNNRKGSIFVAQYFATFEYLLWMMSEHSERLMSSGPCIQKDKGVGLKVTSSNAINRMDSGGKKQLSTIRGLYTNDTSVNHVDENEELTIASHLVSIVSLLMDVMYVVAIPATNIIPLISDEGNSRGSTEDHVAPRQSLEVAIASAGLSLLTIFPQYCARASTILHAAVQGFPSLFEKGSQSRQSLSHTSHYPTERNASSLSFTSKRYDCDTHRIIPLYSSPLYEDEDQFLWAQHLASPRLKWKKPNEKDTNLSREIALVSGLVQCWNLKFEYRHQSNRTSEDMKQQQFVSSVASALKLPNLDNDVLSFVSRSSSIKPYLNKYRSIVTLMMLGSSSWLNEITANVPENATSLRELYDKLLFTNGGRVGRVHSLRTPQQPRASVRLSVSCNNYQQNNKYWTAEGDQQRPGLISNVPISNQLVISNVSGNINEQNHDRDNKTASTREPPTVVGSLLQHQTRNMTNLNGSLLNHSKKSNDNDPVSSTNSSSTIHDSVATLTALLSNFELHADQQTQIEEELHNSRVENNRLQQCITSIKREYQCEIAGLKQDNCTLQEINSKIKAAALEEASRHATELSRAMRLLEERQQVIDELKKENSTLAGRLKRQEAKTQQILGMLQSD